MLRKPYGKHICLQDHILAVEPLLATAFPNNLVILVICLDSLETKTKKETNAIIVARMRMEVETIKKNNCIPNPGVTATSPKAKKRVEIDSKRTELPLSSLGNVLS